MKVKRIIFYLPRGPLTGRGEGGYLARAQALHVVSSLRSYQYITNIIGSPIYRSCLGKSIDFAEQKENLV